MKIDFHPNKRRLILLSCPLQLISIDSRSPNGLHSLPNFKMVIKMCFNSRSPSRLRLSISAVYIVLLPVSIHAAQAGCDGDSASVASSLIWFQFTQPKRAATFTIRICFTNRPSKFQFTQPKRAATDKKQLAHLWMSFQFTQPKRAATSATRAPLAPALFQFTQPKRAATDENSVGT